MTLFFEVGLQGPRYRRLAAVARVEIAGRFQKLRQQREIELDAAEDVEPKTFAPALAPLALGISAHRPTFLRVFAAADDIRGKNAGLSRVRRAAR